uniref:Uncharacterized protein n=1 Tax=Arundo donax TaxID=35708 RepID=A0A0A9DX29_ARUDO
MFRGSLENHLFRSNTSAPICRDQWLSTSSCFCDITFTCCFIFFLGQYIVLSFSNANH